MAADDDLFYVFKKGVGWFPSRRKFTGRTKIGYDCDNKPWLIQELELGETPEIGECWDATAKFDTYSMDGSDVTSWIWNGPASYVLWNGEKFIIMTRYSGSV